MIVCHPFPQPPTKVKNDNAIFERYVSTDFFDSWDKVSQLFVQIPQNFLLIAMWDFLFLAPQHSFGRDV